jgi:hypothetical protein
MILFLGILFLVLVALLIVTPRHLPTPEGWDPAGWMVLALGLELSGALIVLICWAVAVIHHLIHLQP